MSKLNGRLVRIARVHAAVHFEGVGSMTSPITADSAKKKGALELRKVEGGLLLKYGKSEMYVPDGNLQSLQLGTDEENSPS